MRRLDEVIVEGRNAGAGGRLGHDADHRPMRPRSRACHSVCEQAIFSLTHSLTLTLTLTLTGSREESSIESRVDGQGIPARMMVYNSVDGHAAGLTYNE